MMLEVALEVFGFSAVGAAIAWAVAPAVVRGLRRVTAGRSELVTSLIVVLAVFAAWSVVSVSVELLKHRWGWVGVMGHANRGLISGGVLRSCVCWSLFERRHERRRVRVGVTVRRGDTGAGLARCRVTLATDAPSLWAVVGRGLAGRIDPRDGTFETSLGLTEPGGALHGETFVWFRKAGGGGDDAARRITVRLEAGGYLSREIERPLELGEPDDDEPLAVDFGEVVLTPVGDGADPAA